MKGNDWKMLERKMSGKRKCIVSWTRWVDTEKLKVQIGERKLYLWGIDESGSYVSEFLEKKGFRIEGYIENRQVTNTMNLQLVHASDEVLPLQNVFIIVTVPDYCADIFQELDRFGYELNENCLYLYHKITVSACSYYSDSFGNQIIGQLGSGEEKAELPVEILGYGSKIVIGPGCKIGSGCEIKAGYNSYIEIGADCSFGSQVLLSAGVCSRIQIGSSCVFRHNSQIVSGGRLTIGKGSRFGEYFCVVARASAPVFIGEECLFSYYVKVRSDNGHSIFDLEKKKNLYMDQEKYVHIDRHVWVGMGVSILNNAEVGADSVIGADSLVKGKFPANVMLAGTPARIIRENVAWARGNNLSYEDWMKKK